MKISAVIISLNEADHIGRCVQQAMKFCDEVIVVDAESSDGTAEIASENGANVFIRPWEGYGQTKNFGNQQTRNDWILSLDADEVLSDDWIERHKGMEVVKGTIYSIDLVTFYFGKRLRHSGFYPLWKKRLFNRNEVTWNEDPVHEALIYKSDIKLKKLKGKVWHYSFKSKKDYVQKLDNYARLGAQKWINRDKNPSWIKKRFGPAFRFFKTYILDLGMLDGKAGYEIALMNMNANRKKIEYFIELSEKG